MSRIVFHIDVNSAFLSWSAKQVLEKGYTRDIRNEVSVVWFKEKWKSIVVAASTPAKKIWIKVPMKIFEVQKLYPKVVIAPPDYEYYKKCSDEMMEIIRTKFKVFQQYSIDECFVEYTEDMQEIYWEPVRVADELREYIWKKCWFTVNVWIWNNKLLAKMASDFEKPNKTHTLFSEEVKEKMRPLPIRDLFGCWSKTEKELKKMWILSIQHLANKTRDEMKARMWTYGVLLWEYANGIDDSKVEDTYDERKWIWASSITRVDTKDRDYILTFLEEFATELAYELRDRKKVWDIVHVHIRYSTFKFKSHQLKFHSWVNRFKEIYPIAVKLFDELWDWTEINLVGLSISWLKDERVKQKSIFSML